ncbi:MAG TPA: ribosome biogenesis GTP-binding protein YihA/YsxC [Candidatus Kapabacteria bacterium]|nr:ribosome biogenesis GTP-binding protein YihA/YsxC [Candidatus Kapabacteria bacterium]
MLRINSADFVISAAGMAQFPRQPMPEVAFAGRSNVGKSSLLNLLVGRKSLAKTSGTPGKTQQINFFLINGQFHLVDLPGYGYAKVSKTEREAWARLIESYLRARDQLRLVVALSDIRHEPPAIDIELFRWLDAIGRPFLIVLTKHDKISPALADARRSAMIELASTYAHCVGVIAVSSTTRHNRDRLLGVLGKALAGEPIAIEA